MTDQPQTSGRLTKVQARREVRQRISKWLHVVGSEIPDDPTLSDEVMAEWEDEVKRCATRIASV